MPGRDSASAKQSGTGTGILVFTKNCYYPRPPALGFERRGLAFWVGIVIFEKNILQNKDQRVTAIAAALFPFSAFVHNPDGGHISSK